MPDREFIHSSADVSSTLLFAIDSGLQVMLDEPQPEPQPRMLTRADAASLDRGVFYLFESNWVFGPIQTMDIPAGYNKGKYFVQPRVNFTCVSVYFGGERTDQGRRRLGSASVSWHRDWLELPRKVVRPAPPEVRDWYKRIVAHLSSRIVVTVGVHRYHVSGGVLADPGASKCLPPFDFIPWGDDVLRRPL
jgi:hypothetical protein